MDFDSIFRPDRRINMIDQQFLKENLLAYEIPCPDGLTDKLDQYASLLVEWNEKMNLTAITDPEGIVIKHFLDSLLLLKAYPLEEGASMIDVGTGAGFPSIPVAAARPDLKLTLLDSLQKRIHFLETVCDSLSIPAQCIHARAEEAGRMDDFREQYDCATARAVARLRELAEYCLPFVRVGGSFVALKGGEIEEELEEAKFAVKQLGGKIEKVEKFTLPGDLGRSIVVIRKTRSTPAKFPRPSGKIKKNPLSAPGKP